MGLRILFLRAFVENSNGGYYSPLHGDDCYTLLPIPEKSRLRQVIDDIVPGKIIDRCTGYSLEHFYPLEYKGYIHNDPRLDLGFYTDYYMPRGRLPVKKDKRLGKNDLVLFVAGLARYKEGLWDERRSLRELRKAFREARHKGLSGIYLVGGIRILDVADVSLTGWEKAISDYPVLKHSPHYARINDEPVALIGEGFFLEPPVKIADHNLKPTMSLVSMMRENNAYLFMRNNYRRTRVFWLDELHVEGLVPDNIILEEYRK